MIDGVNTAAVPLASSTAADGAKPRSTSEAAQQFEALLVAQLLKSARETSGGGWMGTGEDDQAGLMAIEMAEQQFATLLSAQGGLGLAKMVTQGLEKAHDKPVVGNGSTKK